MKNSPKHQDPFEFDTQTRQELFNNDTGALPDNGQVASDYRFLQYACEFAGYDEEPDSKGPRGITRDSRRRATELFYQEVQDHNEAYQESAPITENLDSQEVAVDESWPEEYRDEYWDEMHENCEYEGAEADLIEIDGEILQIEELKDLEIAKNELGRKNEKNNHSWSFLTGDRQRTEVLRSKALRKMKKAA